ncbi:protein-L-isoaspartate O-methyltransferase [Nitrobacter winogradskyi]|nr:protein-L-isoaspartate O-methyltransferase [Nitrobacter winogradskyi]
MVDGQVRPSDVTDPRIIDAMTVLPREIFVPEDRRALAYLDLDLDVGEKGAPKRHLIKPVVVAKMIQAAEIKTTDNVLVVGCATGYTAALMAKLADRVTATESDPALAAKASDNLASLGLRHVTIVPATASNGAPARAPYDVIILEGATEIVPDTLYGQLAPEGRLVGVFAIGGAPRAVIVTRSRSDFGSRPLFDASAPILPGLERPPAFVF